MDNVSSIEFKYEIIRQQKKQSKNIFEFAANLSIIQNNNLFLQVEDICIIDFIHKLSLYNANNDLFEFVPIDSNDKVLIINDIDSKNVRIMSAWSNKTIVAKKEDLINAIELLKISFENEIKVEVEKYYNRREFPIYKSQNQ